MDLQLALVVAGALVIALVITVSLVERARRPRARRLEPEGDASGAPRLHSADVAAPPVSAAPDIHPAAGAASGRKSLRSDALADPGEPTGFDAIDDAPGAVADAAHADEKFLEPATPDEAIDFILSLPGGGPVERDTALGIFKQHEYRLEKPRRLYGRHHQGVHWFDLECGPSDLRYSDLALAIQLTDNRGPIDESELNTFAQVGLKLADALARPTRFSLTFEDALARARELQVFSEAYDVIAGINVMTHMQPFRGRAVEQAAARAGLKLGARNIFHMKSDSSPGCRHLFSMANLFQPGDFNPDAWDSFETKGLALFMSVPCAQHPAAVFVKMITAAKLIGEELDGDLMDQDKKPLSDKGLAIIRRQIEEIDRKMSAYGVAPGSRAALRLFRESLIA
jgi:hypothetical protein